MACLVALMAVFCLSTMECFSEDRETTPRITAWDVNNGGEYSIRLQKLDWAYRADPSGSRGRTLAAEVYAAVNQAKTLESTSRMKILFQLGCYLGKTGESDKGRRCLLEAGRISPAKDTGMQAS